MKYKPYAAFGTIIIHVQAEPTDTRKVEIGQDGLVESGYYYYVKGAAKVRVVETNEQLEDRCAGWLNGEHDDASAKNGGKNLELTFLESTEWLCISHKYNEKGLPNISSLVVLSGEEMILENNTNLFLGSGVLEITNKIFTGPCQIRIRSGDTMAKCTSTINAYALKFK
jgi:hypothetical protein